MSNGSYPTYCQKHDAVYIKMATLQAELSKCCRARYGSVLLNAQKIVIGTGYNGKPAGSRNDHLCYREDATQNAKDKPSCCLHSEINTLSFTDRSARLGGTLYVSGIPCRDCALAIMQSGVTRLVYFDGATAEGHRGNADASYWTEYGFDEAVERVPFTWAAWNSLYGWLNKPLLAYASWQEAPLGDRLFAYAVTPTTPIIPVGRCINVVPSHSGRRMEDVVYFVGEDKEVRCTYRGRLLGPQEVPA
jgi:dCMP deaminase